MSASYINDDKILDMGNIRDNSIADIWFLNRYLKIHKEHNKISDERFLAALPDA